MAEHRLARFGIAVAIAGLAAAACTTRLTPIAAIPSPDGSIVADWYRVSGGTDVRWTAGYVRLRKSADPFVARNDDVLQLTSDAKLTIVWKSNTQLEITYPAGETVARAYPKWNNVAIVYRIGPK